MSDDSEVAVLIKELLILNRVENTATFVPPTLKEVEGEKSERKRLRQELVQALHRRNRKRC